MTRLSRPPNKWAQPVYTRIESQPTVSRHPDGLVQNSLELVLNRRNKREDDPPVEPPGDINAVSLYNRLGQRYFECGHVADALHCLLRATEFCGRSCTAPRQILLAKTQLNIIRICLSIGEANVAFQQAQQVRDDLLALIRTLDDLRPKSQSIDTDFLAEEAAMTLCFSWHALALALPRDSPSEEAMGYYSQALEYCKSHLGQHHGCYGSLLAARESFAEERAAKSAAASQPTENENSDVPENTQHGENVSGNFDDHHIDSDSSARNLRQDSLTGDDTESLPIRRLPVALDESAIQAARILRAYDPKGERMTESAIARTRGTQKFIQELKRMPSTASAEGSAPQRSSTASAKSRGKFYKWLKCYGAEIHDDIGIYSDTTFSDNSRSGSLLKNRPSQRVGQMKTDLAKSGEKPNVRASTIGLRPASPQSSAVKDNPFEEFVQGESNRRDKRSRDNLMCNETFVKEAVDVLRNKSLTWKIETRAAMEIAEPRLPFFKRSSSAPSGVRSSESARKKLHLMLARVEKSHKDICKANPECMMEFINTSEQTHGDDDHMVNSFKEAMEIASKEEKNLGVKSFLKEDTAKFFRARFAKLRSEAADGEASVALSTQIFEQQKALAKRLAEEEKQKKAEEEKQKKGGKRPPVTSNRLRLPPGAPSVKFSHSGTAPSVSGFGNSSTPAESKAELKSPRSPKGGKPAASKFKAALLEQVSKS